MQGFDLTFLSMVGLLGLSGILVNNSIILISRIEQRMDEGEEMRDAVINGICDRLRAVTLTSLTTVLGLAPLLFETSTQAQFLLPMVITISWGLAFASLIVLLLVPSVLGAGRFAGALWWHATPTPSRPACTRSDGRRVGQRRQKLGENITSTAKNSNRPSNMASESSHLAWSGRLA